MGATGASQTSAKGGDLLEESQVKGRSEKFLVLGARREGGSMAPIGFHEEQGLADAAAGALVSTGWKTVEVWKRVSVHERK